MARMNDNSSDVLKAVGRATLLSLEEIGGRAESHAKEYEIRVDTGRLRNSITHAVDNDDSTVVVGTNVEYAIYQELGTRKISALKFLTRSITDHVEEYKTVVNHYFKEL